MKWEETIDLEWQSSRLLDHLSILCRVAAHESDTEETERLSLQSILSLSAVSAVFTMLHTLVGATHVLLLNPVMPMIFTRDTIHPQLKLNYDVSRAKSRI